MFSFRVLRINHNCESRNILSSAEGFGDTMQASAGMVKEIPQKSKKAENQNDGRKRSRYIRGIVHGNGNQQQEPGVTIHDGKVARSSMYHISMGHNEFIRGIIRRGAS